MKNKINISNNTQKLLYQKLLHITRYTPYTCTKHTPDSLTIIHILHPLTSTPTPTHAIHLTSLSLITLCIHIKLHSVHNQIHLTPHTPTPTSSPFYTQTHMHILEEQKVYIAKDVLSKIQNVM